MVSSENWGQWALIGSVTMTAYISPGYELSYWQYPAAAVISAFNLQQMDGWQYCISLQCFIEISGRNFLGLGSHAVASWTLPSSRALCSNAWKSL